MLQWYALKAYLNVGWHRLMRRYSIMVVRTAKLDELHLKLYKQQRTFDKLYAQVADRSLEWDKLLAANYSISAEADELRRYIKYLTNAITKAHSHLEAVEGDARWRAAFSPKPTTKGEAA